MLIKLNVEAQEDLKLLIDMDPEYVEQFCNLAIEFIKGTSSSSQQQHPQTPNDVRASLQRVSSIAANRLQRDRAQIERTIQALAYLFISSSKASLTAEEFQFSLFDLGFSEHLMQLLTDTFSREMHDLRQLLSMGTRAADIIGTDAIAVTDDQSASVSSSGGSGGDRHLMRAENRYKDLRWRLDVEVDSRMVRHHVPKVRYLVQLDTTANGPQFFQAEYQDLVHMCSTLETALRELHSVNVRRVKTYIR